jgi:hypothetical protein
MAHQRTTIRNALKAMLLNNTYADNRVYANRAFNIDKAKLPAIHIYDESEAISDRVLNAQRLLRKITMKIDLRVTSSSTSDTDLDDLSKQVEDIISADRRLSGTCSSSIYQGMETSFEIGEKTIGRATLTYEITYLT